MDSGVVGPDASEIETIRPKNKARKLEPHRRTQVNSMTLESLRSTKMAGIEVLAINKTDGRSSSMEPAGTWRYGSLAWRHPGQQMLALFSAKRNAFGFADKIIF